MNKAIPFTILLLSAFCFPAATQPTFSMHLSHTLYIGGTGGWDYLATGPLNNWLYVSHGSRVNIINKITGDSAGMIDNTEGVHGIAFDVAQEKGYTSNGRLNTVSVFDIHNNKVLGQIAVGQNPDAIFYEPYSKKIITCNGNSDNLSVIDPVKDIVTDSVSLTGKPETAVSDGAGKIYVNIEDKNEITVVDTKTWKILHHWSLAPGEGPTGLAIDTITKKIFAGCSRQLIVLDITTGIVTNKIAIGDGCDGVAFDAVQKNIYTSNGEGTLTVIHESAGSVFSVVKNIPTKKGARTLALDQATHKIYLPVAEYEPMSPGQTGRPAIKAGTFQVLVLEN